MRTETISRGALAGMLGGLVMAMWSMPAWWTDGTGFWAPLNLMFGAAAASILQTTVPARERRPAHRAPASERVGRS